MNVAQLIDKLKDADPLAVVILSRDSEGNGFGELYTVEAKNKVFIPDDQEVWYAELTEYMKRQGYGEEDTHEGDERAIPAVVLWP